MRCLSRPQGEAWNESIMSSLQSRFLTTTDGVTDEEFYSNTGSNFGLMDKRKRTRSWRGASLTFFELLPSLWGGLFLPGGFCLSGQACYGCSFPCEFGLVFLQANRVGENGRRRLLLLQNPIRACNNETFHQLRDFVSWTVSGDAH